MKVDLALLMIILGVVALEPGVWPVSGRGLSPARLERFRQESRAIQGITSNQELTKARIRPPSTGKVRGRRTRA